MKERIAFVDSKIVDDQTRMVALDQTVEMVHIHDNHDGYFYPNPVRSLRVMVSIKTNARKQLGYSLIEMSIFLSVSGLLLSAMVPLSEELIANAKVIGNGYESAADRMRVLNGKKPISADANPYVIKTLDYSVNINSSGVDAAVKAGSDAITTNAAVKKVTATATGG